MSKKSKVENELKEVKSVLPVGNQVLVERIFESELLEFETELLVSTNDKPSNQGFVLAIGPTVDDKVNIKVGDRVLLQGSFVPVPKYGTGTREQNLVYPDMIKAVLV